MSYHKKENEEDPLSHNTCSFRVTNLYAITTAIIGTEVVKNE